MSDPPTTLLLSLLTLPTPTPPSHHQLLLLTQNVHTSLKPKLQKLQRAIRANEFNTSRKICRDLKIREGICKKLQRIREEYIRCAGWVVCEAGSASDGTTTTKEGRETRGYKNMGQLENVSHRHNTAQHTRGK